MKTEVNALIVVEGQTDIDFLSSFISSDFYKVNGSAINDKDLNYIKLISTKKNVIVLTDPDFPGEEIRRKINQKIPNVFNAYVRKEFSIKNHKVGVAESTIDEILNSLNNIHTFSKETTTLDPLTINDMLELGLIGKNSSNFLRNQVCNYYHIGKSNGKQFLKKINLLGITKKEIKKAINYVNN